MKLKDLRAILVTTNWGGDPFWPDGFDISSAIIELTAEDGTVGLGETVLGYFCPEAVQPIVDYFRSLLIDKALDPTEPDRTCRELEQLALWWGWTGAGLSVLSGIEMAMWDLVGKLASRPVCDLLGGSAHASLPVYASGATAGWPVERAVEQARHYVDIGFRAIKLGTGYFGRPSGTWYAASEAERVREEHAKLSALRGALGDGVDLAIDSHAMQIREPWSLSSAVAIACAVEEFDLLFYEEPFRYGEYEQYARLRSATRIPIAGGECLTGVAAFQPYLDTSGLDYVQPDASHVGGISTAYRVAELADARHLGLLVHTGGSIGPGFMANVHVAFASRNARAIEYVVATTARDQLLVEPTVLRDGRISRPTAPGLGVELPPSFVDDHPFRIGAVGYC